MTQPLADQFQRDRFVNETGRNFSVVAPAGVGKTYSITKRIGQLAQIDSITNPVLPRLVLVTYTRKAAQEMLFRARSELVENNMSANKMAQLKQAYFGTIHSYCLNILQRFALRMGLPPKLEIIQNEEELWADFIRSRDALVPNMPESWTKPILQMMPIEALLKLARKVSPKAFSDDKELPLMPFIDIQPMQDIPNTFKNGKPKAAICTWQKTCSEWVKALEDGEFAPIPTSKSKANDVVVSQKEDLKAYRNWLGEASLVYAKAIAEEFRKYKLQQGMVSFDDIIHLAVQVVRTPEYVAELRAEKPIILLDEAQDTDKQQFEVLLEVARPLNARGQWLNGGVELPEQGRFSMVGDPQQAIYSSRTDVSVYEGIRKRLCQEGGAEHLSFAVTMRCDRSIVEAMNKIMPEVLNARNEQVAYVEMAPGPKAKEGQLLFANLDLPEENDNVIVYAKAFAQWLQSQSLQTLRASDWEQVAILCPRKSWLSVLNEALCELGIETQVVSDSSILGDNPAYAWVTALFKIIADPYDSFEIVGVLRDIFVISDDSIAHYVQRHFDKQKEHPINLVNPVKEASEVSRKLEDLSALRAEIEQMSLHDALKRVVERTQLEKRIQHVPSFKPEVCLDMLNHLYELADAAEEQRHSPDEWVKALEEQLGTDVSESSVRKGAIQLMTMHKSKGLGFDAVLLPFSYKGIGEANPNYPDYYGKVKETVIVDGIHKDAFAGYLEDLEQGKRNEYARLAYVAMTRTKHTLVLFNDVDQVGKSSKLSFMDYLVKGKPDNNSFVQSLPDTLTEDPGIEIREALEETASYTNVPDYSVVKSILESSGKRVTPSSLAKHSEAEFFRSRTEEGLSNDFEEGELETVQVNDPAAYGNWWHETMEKLPWGETEDILRLKGDECLQNCPDANRGSGELEKFFSSDLLQEIKELGGQCYCEVPMLWGNSQGDKVFEGYIDFLAVSSEKILLVDWKTDRQPIDKIVGTYKKQIIAYREALADAYSVEIKVCIYSTVHAQSITL